MIRSKTLMIALAAVVTLAACPQDAQAGPLLDWLRGVCRRPRANAPLTYTNYQAANCQTCPQTTQTFVPQPRIVNTSLQAANPAGLQPGQCIKTCNQTCSRTVVNYVPVTSYRTAWNRVPVTQYRPVTNSDPCTGCTVTCMRPCTTYTWQMKREPYTTYRPVYRQENYTVPVTTITNDCATGACNTCQTCPTVSQAPTYTYPGTIAGAPAPSYPNSYGSSVVQPGSSVQGEYFTYPDGTTAPSGTLNTDGGFSTPADQAPAIDAINPQNSQRPVIRRFDSQGDYSDPKIEGPLMTIRKGLENTRSRLRSVTAPQNNNGWMNVPVQQPTRGDYTAQSPVTKRWAYSPVRLASYTKVEAPAPERRQPTRISGVYQPMKKATPKPKKKNAGWQTVDW